MNHPANFSSGNTLLSSITRRRVLFYIFLPLFTGLCLASTSISAPNRPFPQHVDYAPGTLRPDHRTQSRQDDDVRALYYQWKGNYLVRVDTQSDKPVYRISYGKTNPARTVSEGQGYGMLIVTLMAGYDPEAQTILNGLFRFSRLHPSSVDNRLMAWEVPENPETGVDAAFDGDADIAHALLLADNQWGSSGEINYRAEADTILTAIISSMIGPESHLPMLGDWVSREGTPYSQYTPRSSDFIPDHFRAWHRLTGDSRWQNVLSAVQSAISSIQERYSPTTGLLPDFMVPVSTSDHNLKPAPANFLEGSYDGEYEYNAGRDPWRIAIDGLLDNDATSLAQAGKIADWIAAASGKNPANIKAGYYLDGRVLPEHDYFTSFIAAPFAVAVMTRPGLQTFLNDLYDSIRTREEDYYEDSVAMLCMLVLTGNYWAPERQEHPGAPLPDIHYLPATSLLLLTE